MDKLQEDGVRVGLTIMVVRGGKILMGLRQGTETADGLWAYPGGRMDYGEDPVTGVIRELFEETGMTVNREDVEFLRFANEPFPKEGKHYVTLVFFTTKAKGEPKLKEDKCGKWKMFSPLETPENSFYSCVENTEKYRSKIEGTIV